jgi:hypothetical protein
LPRTAVAVDPPRPAAHFAASGEKVFLPSMRDQVR